MGLKRKINDPARVKQIDRLILKSLNSSGMSEQQYKNIEAQIALMVKEDMKSQ